MKKLKKQCPFCKGIMTPLYNGNRENHVIYGWECSRSNCQFNLENGEMLLHRNMKKIMKMQARIDALTKAYDALPEIIVNLDDGDLYDVNNLYKVLEEHLGNYLQKDEQATK